MIKVDVLVFAAHPDDAELSCSGTIVKEVKQGKVVAVVDITQGELGTRGSIETRYAEAKSASEIMGIHYRENLKLPDGFFEINQTSINKVIQCIRKYQPDMILANSLEDRHPDHARAGKLVEEAAFLAGLRKIETFDAEGNAQPRWRAAYVLHYVQDVYHHPNVVIDITDVSEQRMKAISAYSSQFNSPGAEEPATYISTPSFYEAIVARARLFGKLIGVQYAEGYVSRKAIGIKNFDALIQVET
jgi:N-acetylglucosamine malate deacetylase 1